ncbi:pex2 pex12 amino terminal region [Zalerion maritima]|uniref:Peroxisome assembly protein 12 n=1 Tax=Zalerion maritima TaxID=339359 RepID=A0AAD5WUU3_9PEZI|nr:pex2 pex12 amino terminal region [Zalerion maritima]
MEPIDELKPSLFELLAEQQLSSLLPPTIRYLLTVLTHRYPRYLLRVLNSYDEIYALAMLVVERHYLKTRGGSFTENFYGLKRERALAAGIELPRASSRAPFVVREQLQLGKGDVWRNLLVLVIVPYLRRKVEEHHDINAPRALLGSVYTRLPPNPTIKDRLVHFYRWFLLNMYPRAHAAYGLVLLAFNLVYLSDNSRFHNPLMWLVKTRMRRMGGADYKAIDDLTKPTTSAGARPGTSFFSPRNLGHKALSSLSLALPASIFALKFLEWWYASDFAKQLSRKASENLDLPPPIVTGADEAKMRREIEERREGEQEEKEAVVDATNAPIAASSMLPIYTVPPPEDSGLCPICEDKMVMATACQTGVVYCYSCIHRWIEGEHPKQEHFMVDKEGRWESGKGRCAVTGRRVLGGTGGLRRIMV